MTDWVLDIHTKALKQVSVGFNPSGWSQVHPEWSDALRALNVALKTRVQPGDSITTVDDGKFNSVERMIGHYAAGAMDTKIRELAGHRKAMTKYQSNMDRKAAEAMAVEIEALQALADEMSDS